MNKNTIIKEIISIAIVVMLLGTPVFAATQSISTEQNIEILPIGKGSTLYVGGTGPGNYTTIQAAVDVASPGDLIFVYNGIYYENVEIYKTINLLGENRENVIIDGGDGSQVLHVTTNHVNISEIQITNSHHGIHLEYASYTTIKNCIVTGTDYSITPRNSPYTTVINCNSYHNKNVGVRIITSPNSDVLNCSLSNTQSGVFITDSADCTITNCNAYNISMITLSNGGSGYYFENSPNGFVENCVAYNCSNYGIYFLTSQDCTATNCIIYNNTYDPDAMFPSWYHSVGICIYGSPYCAVTNCMIFNSDNGIYFRAGSKNCILKNNVFYNNAEGNFDFLGLIPKDFDQDIDTSNTVDGKPVIYLVNANGLSFNETDDIGYLGLVSSGNITVTNLDISGILLVDTADSIISNVGTHDCKKGMYIYNSPDCTVLNSQGFNNRFGIYGSSENLINCTFYDNEYGIYLEKEEKISGGGEPINGGNVINCYSYDNEVGIFDQKGSHISDCEFYNNSEYGFILSCEAQKPSEGSILRNNNIHDNCYNFFSEGWEATGYAYQDIDDSNMVNGKSILYIVDQHGQVVDGATTDIGLVVLVSCSGMTVQNVSVSGNKHGLLLVDTIDSTILNCDFYNNKDGIWLIINSINNLITNCNCYNNERGIAAHGGASSQTVRNCHLYNNSRFGYWTQLTQNNKIIGCTVNDNGFAYSEEQASYPYSLQYGGPGILLHYITPNNLVENCTIYNNYEGIYVFDNSDAQTLRNCEIFNNTKHGICIRRESYCLVENCSTYQNQVGISLVESTDNIIKNCDSFDNDYGFYIITSSNNNDIYHNNIMNNTQNAFDSCSNTWDDDYPSGGNYWSDYTGEDNDGDGIGDTPYPIPGGGNEDRYPFMDPQGVNNPPYIPSDPTPSDGATDIDINTDISWTGGDPDGDTVIYDIYFGSSSPPSQVETGYTATSYEPGVLEYNTTYFWKIIAWDSFGASTEGPIWSFTTEAEPQVNQPPSAPDISGETNGLVGEEYEYRFISTDDEQDQIYYFVDWGDDTTTGWVGPFNSGETILLNHSWTEEDTYSIQAKAKDEHGLESDWATLEVIMPVSKQNTVFSLFIEILQKILDRFPLLIRLITTHPFISFLFSFFTI